MSDNFDPTKFRPFFIEGANEPFCMVSVTAIIGKGGPGREIDCSINPDTGVLQIPEHNLFGKIGSEAGFEAHKNALVTGFHMKLVHAANDRLAVLQRQGRSNKYRKSGRVNLPGDELVEVNLPQCKISHWERTPEETREGQGPMAVWTNPMNREGSNRIDVVLVGQDGSLDLFCIYLVTLDDGRSFRLVGMSRWIGQVRLRQNPETPYVWRNPDDRAKKVYDRHSHVREMLQKYVFVPGDHTDDISTRLQMLESKEVCELIGSASPSVWNGSEDFWINRIPSTQLRPGQARIKFLTYGVGRGSMGIAEYDAPDGKKASVQFDHHSVKVASREFNVGDQGIYFLPPGTVVEISGLRDMGPDYPPFATIVVPLEVPVAIKPRTRTAA